MNRYRHLLQRSILFASRLPALLLIILAKFYQKTLSPWMPFHCRFRPTCSEYFIEAVKKHGAWRGSLLGLWRLLRCQPLCRGGDDPVP
ncbi:MAG: membrane protein insertion efficiency factor YidD [Planctomycetes bacterium]|nr:membrane protein insertion efficiency factor YidD [Planctomycetota bacterium]